jgi:hypothetical protein
LWWTLAIGGSVATLQGVGCLHYLACPDDIDESPEPAMAIIFDRRVDVGINEVRVEGEVRNILNVPLRGVKIVVSWYDRPPDLSRHPELGIVASKITSLDVDPLMPGQTTRFGAVFPRDPAMVTYHIDFKTSWGCGMVLTGVLEAPPVNPIGK